MKKYYVFILLFIVIGWSTEIFAQQDSVANKGKSFFSVQFAQCYAKFRYSDSQGFKDENLTTDIRYCYGASFTKVFHSGFFMQPEIGYKNYGATSLLDQQKLLWSLHYLDINYSLGYSFRVWKFEPRVFESLYFSYLYKAEQEIGLDCYDMLKDKVIKNNDYGINLGAGLHYWFSKNAGFFAEYRYCFGLNQLETNDASGSNQKMFNRAMSIHFGLSFNTNI